MKYCTVEKKILPKEYITARDYVNAVTTYKGSGSIELKSGTALDFTQETLVSMSVDLDTFELTLTTDTSKDVVDIHDINKYWVSYPDTKKKGK